MKIETESITLTTEEESPAVCMGMTTTQDLIPHSQELNGLEECAAGECCANVGKVERLGSVGVGLALLASALSKRSLGSVIFRAIGVSLLYRGFTGRCMAYESLGKRMPLTRPSFPED